MKYKIPQTGIASLLLDLQVTENELYDQYNRSKPIDIYVDGKYATTYEKAKNLRIALAIFVSQRPMSLSGKTVIAEYVKAGKNV